MVKSLDFEQPVASLESAMTKLEQEAEKHPSPQTSERLEQARLEWLDGLKALYAGLTAWQTVQVARHPDRPHADDIISAMCDDFVELRGDRTYSDDAAMLGGIARLGERVVMVLGHRKGHTTKQNVARNFGMPHPEGYRKARRLMGQAAKFGMPLVCLLDTPAAASSLTAEERGQSWALADNLTTMATLQVPILVTVIGEGGSGGALAIGVGDRLLMLEHAIYSVASPEACASIVWKDAKHAPDAAEALQLTAPDLARLGVADRLVSEPVGGAHRDPGAAAETLQAALGEELDRLCQVPLPELLERRYQRLRQWGPFLDGDGTGPPADGAFAQSAP